MAWVLDIIYALGLMLASPWLVVKAWRRGATRLSWREKLLGRVPRQIGDRPCIWFHAVSVGEVLLLRPLVAELARRRPHWNVVISSTTATGLAMARTTFPDLVTFFAPFDFSWATRRAVARIKPTVLALVELELWPNLIAATRRAGGRVAVINGRLSAKSHRGYARLGRLLRSTLWRLDAVAAQTPEYAARFASLGIPAARVITTGSVKYDGLESRRDNPRTERLRAELGLSPTELVFVAGSTFDQEEVAAYRAYRAAKESHPGLRLIVVPRHPHRFDAVAAELARAGARVVRRSAGPATPDREAVFLVDAMGELSALYGLADVAFVGGSLSKGRGGQNMMEPAAFGASVLFGPHTENFRAPVELLLGQRAARVVQNEQELAEALRADLDDPETAARRGEHARALVQAQQGATARTFAVLDALVGTAAAGWDRAALSGPHRRGDLRSKARPGLSA